MGLIRDSVERAGSWYAGRLVRTLEDFGMAVDIPRVKADHPDARPIKIHPRSDRAKRHMISPA